MATKEQHQVKMIPTRMSYQMCFIILLVLVDLAVSKKHYHNNRLG